jgi:hypothetical protein
LTVKKTIALALGAAMLAGVVGCGKGSGGSSEAAVTVNGTPVLLKDYYDYLIRKPTVLVATPQGSQEAQVVETLGLQALNGRGAYL